MNDKFCGICYENVNSNIIFGNCSHKMCVKCIKKLCVKICPFCRGKLPSDISDILKVDNIETTHIQSDTYDFIIDDQIEYINSWNNMLN